MKFPALLFLVALIACSIGVAADDDHHHFDPSEKLGTVSFPTSCAPAVQKSFERGVALLHSFAYEEADMQFQEIEQKDPRCAIAYWGEAMTLYHALWNRVSQDDLKRGWELLKKADDLKAKTKREREYISALSAFYRHPEKPEYDKRPRDYASAMQKVYEKYPDDHEAAIFYALSLLSSSNGMEHARKAVSILNILFEQQPDHPGVAHYLIHACDNPRLAAEGLAAARRYASIAPSAPHALHMPSHIFIRLGLWQDDIDSNLAAIAAADKQTAMHLHTAHNRIHSMDYLEYAYLQIGDDASAQAMIDELGKIKREDLELEFQPYFNAMHALFTAHYALETRQWKAALALQPIPDVEPRNRALTFWAQAIAAGHLHDAQAARQAVEQYDAMVTATEKSDKPYAAKGMKTDADEAHAWLAFAESRNDEALNLLRAVAQKQDEIGKGEVEIPAREMLADMLLEMGRPQEALVEYERSLHTDPNRFNGLYGAAQAAELTHQPEKAAAYYAQLLKNCDNGIRSDRPELAKAKAQLTLKSSI